MAGVGTLLVGRNKKKNKTNLGHTILSSQKCMPTRVTDHYCIGENHYDGFFFFCSSLASPCPPRVRLGS